MSKKAESKHTKKLGLPPGTLVYTGDQTEIKPELKLIQYNEEQFNVVDSEDLKEILTQCNEGKVNWINISALHDVELIQQVGDHFNLHPLMLEDIVNVDQRPKIEEFEEYLFLTLKMLTLVKGRIKHEHVSLVLMEHFVISFQEREGDVFGNVRERIFTERGRIRKKGADYLFYALTDAVVDNYYRITDHMNAELSKLEMELIDEESEGRDPIKKIVRYKNRVAELRRMLYPLNDALNRLIKGDMPFMEEGTRHYIDDVTDHIGHILQTVDMQREMLLSFTDLHMSIISNRMNIVMKILTVVASIFIPLTFIAGVYGMNFEYMPELHWKYSYPIVLLVMVASGAIMFVYMKNKKWF